ncbi:ketohexokinase-like isoform X2 [Haliotis rubra]|uniref:ketohexokinase-like isoform X2 n=1 Tax=Haliotis rubra TaxID=36100 RepID=UPI001EE60AC3|nr:ketohexokinase-like isoform X2 [Haliotis rubra]
MQLSATTSGLHWQLDVSTKLRCVESKWQRGGNASTTATVLSMLGEDAEFMGTITDRAEQRFLMEDFKTNCVDTKNVIVCEGSGCPTATVIINKQTGSRTILNSRNGLREMSYADFLSVNLDLYKWIHFETRPNCPDVMTMLSRVLDHNARVEDKIVTSVEFENPHRPHHDVLFNMADYMFVSKEFAQHYGYTNMEEAVEGLTHTCQPRIAIICAWGECGAAGKQSTSETVTSPALKLDHVVDTLGAGDTFIAGTLHALAKGRCLKSAIAFGCKLSGFKCGMRGLKGIEHLKNSSPVLSILK